MPVSTLATVVHPLPQASVEVQEQCSPPSVKSTPMSTAWFISMSHTQNDDLGVLRSTCTRKLENLVLAFSWHLPQVATTFCDLTLLAGSDLGRISW